LFQLTTLVKDHASVSYSSPTIFDTFDFTLQSNNYKITPGKAWTVKK